MEPRIQYAKTSDGVNIAYQTVGEGKAIIVTPPPFGHIELEWRLPEFRRWYELLARTRMMVKYDRRGTGLSDRNVEDYSLEALTRDIEAVIDSLGLEVCDLFGVWASGPPCIAYAARRPERVSHLILWCSFASGPDLIANPQMQTFLKLSEMDWSLFTETLAHTMMGWPKGKAAQQFAQLMRQGVTQAAFNASLRAMLEFDVSSLLQTLRIPTLVLHRRDLPMTGVDSARFLAAQIPGARLAVLFGAAVRLQRLAGDALVLAEDVAALRVAEALHHFGVVRFAQ